MRGLPQDRIQWVRTLPREVIEDALLPEELDEVTDGHANYMQPGEELDFDGSRGPRRKDWQRPVRAGED